MKVQTSKKSNKLLPPPNKLTPEKIKTLYELLVKIQKLERERENLPTKDTERSVALYFKIQGKRDIFNKIKKGEPIGIIDKNQS